MRVTIDIEDDDEVYEQIQEFAEKEGIRMRRAYSLLLKEGLGSTGYRTTDRTTERTTNAETEASNFDLSVGRD